MTQSRQLAALGDYVAKYVYDAWGKVLFVTDNSGAAITSATHVGNMNPIRYRGYYWGSESGLYYLQSRYYDSAIGRFINADCYASTGHGVLDKNMFAYCLNNPVMLVDPSGLCAEAHGGYYYCTNPNCPILIAYYKESIKIRGTTSQQGVSFIEGYESFYPNVYDDGFGNATIGYGTLTTWSAYIDGISEYEAEQLLRQELNEHERLVRVYSSEANIAWDANEFDALVSLSYNTGANKTPINMLASGMDPYEVFGMYNKANGQAVLGLTKRRKAEADIFAHGIYNSDH